MHIELLSLNMSVTKNSNNNQLQVEMRLRHALLRGQLCMRIASFYELLTDIAHSAKTLAYTTGTTSKHQRATSPELYLNSIVFLHIVVWHMSVLSLAQRLRLR